MYVHCFWTATSWTEECPYVRRKRERGGLSERHIREQRGTLDRWVLPELGKTRLSAVGPKMVERWLTRLHDQSGPSARTATDTLDTLRTIVREAVRLGALTRDPMATVEPLKEQRKAPGPSFHGSRVLYDGLLRGHDSGEAELRLLTGHKSAAMSDLQTRWKPEDFADV